MVSGLNSQQPASLSNDDEVKLFGEPIADNNCGGDEEMVEAELDGEIIDDEVNPEILRQNEMEAKARAVLQAQKSSSSYL